jgi:hypothetical protein
VSRLRLSDLQRADVVRRDGERLGHVFELAATTRGDGPPAVQALLVGPFGLARRLGIARGRPRSTIGIEDVVAFEDGRIVVR